MNLFQVRKGFDKITVPLMRTCARLPISPNGWTIIAWVWGVVSAFIYVAGFPFFGAALLGVRGLVDHLDGYVARQRGETSILGGVLDEIGDRYHIGFWLIIVTGHLAPRWPHLPWVCAFAVVGTLCNAFVKAVTYVETQDCTREDGKLKHPMDYVGFFGSAEFLVFFGIPTLFAAPFRAEWPVVFGIWASAILSHLSLFQRLRYVAKHYGKRRGPSNPAAAPAGAGPTPAANVGTAAPATPEA
jgi:CDP-diacylglycerol---glycerol-3-phosphate 3-phosphatidyltransferase